MEEEELGAASVVNDWNDQLDELPDQPPSVAEVGSLLIVSCTLCLTSGSGGLLVLTSRVYMCLRANATLKTHFAQACLV